MKFVKLFLLLVSLFSYPIVFGQITIDGEDSPLKSAVRANNLTEVKRLVEAGEEINTSDFMDTEPVDMAVQLGYKEIALFLLSKGASSRRNFYTAVEQGDLAWIKTLISYKYFDDEAMIAAVETDKVEIVKYLVSQGFPINFSQKRRTGLFKKHYVTPLEIALNRKNSAIVIELVKGGAPIQDAFYESCYMEYNDLAYQLIDIGKELNELFLSCSKTNNIEVLKYCLKKGADVNFKDSSGKNALLLAAENGRTEMFNYCLNELKISIHSQSSKNENALMLACKHDNISLVSEIANLLPDIEAVNINNETVLFYAEQKSLSRDIFEIILAKNPNINHQNSEGNTVLIQAASAGRTENVRRLIALGADLNLKNNKGKNVISSIVNYYSSNKQLVYELIQKGADVNVKSENGSDIAYFAIESGDLEMLRLLKEKGVTIDGRSASGNRPTCTKKDVILFVLENGGNPNAKDSWGTSYLCMTLQAGDIELAAVLIRYKVDVNATCSFNETPLMIAIDNQNLLLVQFLVESGADLYAKSSFSKNIMELAIEENNTEIIDYLRLKGALTKEELNKREVERAQEMRKLESLINEKDINSILALLTKYPEAILTQKEIQAIGILSAKNANMELLQLFLERFKWEINSKLNFEQQTMAHLAAAGSNLQFMTLLVNKGANFSQKDAFDKTPLDYAKNKEIKKYLKTSGGK